MESLLDHLDRLSLIDRHRVALQGYSRSCYHDLYFLTHSTYPIAAMICTDSVDGSYKWLMSVPVLISTAYTRQMAYRSLAVL